MVSKLRVRGTKVKYFALQIYHAESRRLRLCRPDCYQRPYSSASVSLDDSLRRSRRRFPVAQVRRCASEEERGASASSALKPLPKPHYHQYSLGVRNIGSRELLGVAAPRMRVIQTFIERMSDRAMQRGRD